LISRQHNLTHGDFRYQHQFGNQEKSHIKSEFRK